MAAEIAEDIEATKAIEEMRNNFKTEIAQVRAAGEQELKRL